MTVRLPLGNKRILVTRPRGQAAPFIDKIKAAGGIAYAVPLIAFRAVQAPNEAIVVSKLYTYDWIVLTSKNGVDFFFQQLEKMGVDRKRISARFVAIGTKTAAVLQEYGFQADYIPEKFSADQLAKEIELGLFQAQNVLIPKGNLARTTIAEALRKQGAQVEEWIVYETFFPKEEKSRLLQLLQSERLDVITFTSPSAVRHFMNAIEEANLSLSAVIACIGPVTEAVVKKFGLSVSICPEEYTIEALIEEMAQYFRKEEE
ncbi:uroporphyrinogen-III synthase [Bacillus sp. REN10]|uniref:uroporphyrinogen-III synthase n=1 Tax=Bacillus sp. REN10 TaxID=2782541 RepID=UPI00193C03CF|nr:uroporphyrinogen-III synthase [Bacillus sp. REN10]